MIEIKRLEYTNYRLIMIYGLNIRIKNKLEPKDNLWFVQYLANEPRIYLRIRKLTYREY